MIGSLKRIALWVFDPPADCETIERSSTQVEKASRHVEDVFTRLTVDMRKAKNRKKSRRVKNADVAP